MLRQAPNGPISMRFQTSRAALLPITSRPPLGRFRLSRDLENGLGRRLHIAETQVAQNLLIKLIDCRALAGPGVNESAGFTRYLHAESFAGLFRQDRLEHGFS